MKLPKELVTVTPLSKVIALILFITVPILAFIYGVQISIPYPTPTFTILPSPTPSVISLDQWTTIGDSSYILSYPRLLRVESTPDGISIDNALDVTYTTLQPAQKTVKNFLMTLEQKSGSLESLTQYTSVEGQKMFGENTFTYAWSGVEGTGIARYYISNDQQNWFVFTHYVYYDNDIDAADRSKPQYLDSTEQEALISQILYRFTLTP